MRFGRVRSTAGGEGAGDILVSEGEGEPGEREDRKGSLSGVEGGDLAGEGAAETPRLGRSGGEDTETLEPLEGVGELRAFSCVEGGEEAAEAVTEEAWGRRPCFLTRLLGENLDLAVLMRVLAGMVRRGDRRKEAAAGYVSYVRNFCTRVCFVGIWNYHAK